MNKVIPVDAILIPTDARLVFEGIIFDVYQWSQELFDGSSATFEMLRRPDTVVAICVVDDKIVVLDDEQPNSGVRKSFPGGRVDKTDASTLISAQREVLEETGYAFNSWRLVKVMQPPTTKIEWFVYIYLAWDVSGRQQPELDGGEKITAECLTFEETKQLVLGDVGFLGEASPIFDGVESVDELLQLPEYEGLNVDR